MSKSALIKCALGVGAAGALALASIAPASAAPIWSGTAALKSAATDHVTDVRWRGRWGGAVAAGVIGGLALGAIASAPYYSYGYAPGYAYAPGYYGYYGYRGYDPAIDGPPYSAYAYRNPTQCYVEGGYVRPNGCW